MQIILDSYGSFLGVTDGMFSVSIKGGSSHSIAVRKVKSILVQKGASLSANAIQLALENNVQIVFTDNIGRPIGQVWNSRFGSIGTIRKQQAYFTQHTQGGHWAIQQVLLKINYQIAFIEQLAHLETSLENTSQRAIKTAKQIVQKVEPLLLDPLLKNDKIAPSLRGWEGSVARQYFKVLSLALSPGYRFKERSRQPAKDWFNCVLNYLYGMLYGQVELALIGAGVDPQLGVLHADQYNKPVLVYDFIEAFRIWAERVTFQLFQGHMFYQNCFELKDKKGIWLAREGKQIAIDAFHKYMKENEIRGNKSFSRNAHINKSAQKLAQEILHFNPSY